MKPAPPPVKPREQLNQDPEKLRWHRTAARMTLTDLAGRAQCSVPYLSQLEHGMYSASPPLLGRLADALGCKTTDLMHERQDAREGMPQPGAPAYQCAKCDEPWTPGYACKQAGDQVKPTGAAA